MFWLQRFIELSPRRRGWHLITEEIIASLPELRTLDVGVAHLFLQHTSASLSINENADSDVPLDLEQALATVAPEGAPYRHTCEGPDDMPAHIKTALLGGALTIPVGQGKLQLGVWQGIFLCEHRTNGGRRRIVATLWGTTAAS